MNEKYNSCINIMGSIPDYTSMIEFMVEEHSRTLTNENNFQFRTEKSLKRFAKAIDDAILQFATNENKELFYTALSTESYSVNDKLMILFWQMLYANTLFREITEEVFMKAVYQGRSALTADDVLSFIRFLKEQHPVDLDWSEVTLKTTASKYLTLLKKFQLAEGHQRKEIRYPVIGSQLFAYFVKWVLSVSPNDRTLDNPYFLFGFLDRLSLINRLKRIEYISLWDIAQIGDEVTIELK